MNFHILHKGFGLEKNLLIYTMLFYISNYQTNYHSFYLKYNLSPFFLITFSTLNSAWFVFWNYFSKMFRNIFTVQITCNYVHSIFNFYNQKNFFRTIWRVTFCKSVFIFWYSCKVTNFKFRIFFIIFSSLKSINVLDFTSIGFILIVLCSSIFQRINTSLITENINNT